MRELLRALPVFAAEPPAFDPSSAPDRPEALFADWLSAAVDAGVPEPHAAALGTVDGTGRPDCRVLILKDVDERGWAFASSGSSRKGGQLAANPVAALAFYWPRLGRQVRVRGPVERADPEESARDFLARSTSARAEALLGRQSRPMESPECPDGELEVATARIAADPSLVAADWTLYRVVPGEVEFWQAARSRRHVRLLYWAGAAGRWSRQRLWP